MKLNSVKVGLFVMMLTMSSVAFPLPADELDIPMPADTDAVYRFDIRADYGYTDEQGRRIIDVIEGYDIYLALSADTADGQPVIGLEPVFDLKGSSRLIPPGQSTNLTSTDESGILEFGIIAGKKGMDQLTVSFGKNTATVYFNIISLQINDFPAITSFQGGLDWTELMQAKLNFVDGELDISFPESMQHQDGEVVKLWGFMMPLDADVKQSHFLMTSSPPHCFFHIPGGPAGVIEVFAETGIEASWEPVLLQGTFKLVTNSMTGVIYQLENAELIEE